MSRCSVVLVQRDIVRSFHFVPRDSIVHQQNPGRDMLALTRAVPKAIAECELTHLRREPIDWARADAQHRRYEAALESLGCRIQRLPPEDGLPDSVFVEDAAVVVAECAVIARPGAESRRKETDTIADALRPYRELKTIEAPGTLDGGDVVVHGRRIYVGISTRTNEDGTRQLAAVLTPLGYSVEPVAVRGCLHLKSAVSALADGRLLLNPKWADRRAFGGAERIEIDPAEPFAANVISLGRTVLVSATAPRTGAKLETHGYRVLAVDASELAKAEAGLTCCSILVNEPGH